MTSIASDTIELSIIKDSIVDIQNDKKQDDGIHNVVNEGNSFSCRNGLLAKSNTTDLVINVDAATQEGTEN